MSENPFQEIMDKMHSVLEKQQSVLDRIIAQQNVFASRLLTDTERRHLKALYNQMEG